MKLYFIHPSPQSHTNTEPNLEIQFHGKTHPINMTHNTKIISSSASIPWKTNKIPSIFFFIHGKSKQWLISSLGWGRCSFLTVIYPIVKNSHHPRANKVFTLFTLIIHPNADKVFHMRFDVYTVCRSSRSITRFTSLHCVCLDTVDGGQFHRSIWNLACFQKTNTAFRLLG